MTVVGIKVRRRFFVSLGLLVVATGIWWFWSRETQAKAGGDVPPPPDSFVKVVGTGAGEKNQLLEERAEFFDPTPLFLPTSRNFQQGPLPSRVIKTPGQVFRDFEPKWHFVESSLPEYGVVRESGSNSLPELLARSIDAPFSGFGVVDQAAPPLSQRSGFIEVKSLKGGELSLSGPIEGRDLPKIDRWVEFMVVIAASGLIGDPLLVVSSEQDELDGKLKDYLVKTYRIGERLAPGRYDVLIGP